MSTTELELLEPLVIRYGDAYMRLRSRTSAAAGLVWDEFGGLSDKDSSRFVDAVTPIIEGAQIEAAGLGDAYLTTFHELATGKPTDMLGLAYDLVTGAGARGGRSTADAYHDAVIGSRIAIANGRSYSDAMDRGRTTAQRIAEDDISNTQLATINADERIVGYRRVLVKTSCVRCAVASTRRYKRGDLMPRHARCDCLVAPIMGTTDPGFVINKALLETLKANGGATYWKNGHVKVEPDSQGVGVTVVIDGKPIAVGNTDKAFAKVPSGANNPTGKPPAWIRRLDATGAELGPPEDWVPANVHTKQAAVPYESNPHRFDFDKDPTPVRQNYSSNEEYQRAANAWGQRFDKYQADYNAWNDAYIARLKAERPSLEWVTSNGRPGPAALELEKKVSTAGASVHNEVAKRLRERDVLAPAEIAKQIKALGDQRQALLVEANAERDRLWEEFFPGGKVDIDKLDSGTPGNWSEYLEKNGTVSNRVLDLERKTRALALAEREAGRIYTEQYTAEVLDMLETRRGRATDLSGIDISGGPEDGADLFRESIGTYPQGWVTDMAEQHRAFRLLSHEEAAGISADMAEQGRGFNQTIGDTTEIYAGANHNKGTMVHEIGHTIEQSRPHVKALEWTYRERRAGDEAAKPIFAESTTEWGVEDKFVDKYIGKRYGSGLPNQSAEVFTVGVQNLLAGKTTIDVHKDPELRNLTLGILFLG